MTLSPKWLCVLALMLATLSVRPQPLTVVNGTTSKGTFKNNSDADQFIYLQSGSTGDYRDYFYWNNYLGVNAWALGRNSVNTFICYDSVANTHRAEFETGGNSYISSGGSGVVIVNGQSEAGTGTGGFRVRSGGASPVTWFSIDSAQTIFGNHTDANYFMTLDSGASATQKGVFLFQDQGTSKFFLGRNDDNTFVLYDYSFGAYVAKFSGGYFSIVAGTGTGTPRVGGDLKVDTTTTGNVGGGEDTLITYSVPANTLSANGQYLDFDCMGYFTNNANTKDLKIYFGSTVIFDSTALVINGVAWRGHGKVIRTGAATQVATCEFTIGGTLLGAVTTTTATDSSPAETLSGAVTFKVTGTDSGITPADNSIVQRAMVLRWQPGN